MISEYEIVEICKHNVAAILHREIEKQYITGNMDMFLIAHHSTILAEIVLNDIAKSIIDKIKENENE